MSENKKIELLPRDYQILVLASAGMNSAQIASKLGITTKTIENRYWSLKRQLGASTRAHVLALAIEAHAIPRFEATPTPEQIDTYLEHADTDEQKLAALFRRMKAARQRVQDQTIVDLTKEK